MPVYGFCCPDCGRERELMAGMTNPPEAPACSCSARMRRRFHPPAIVRTLVTETHFNRSIGKVVSSTAQFRSELARRSDELSERLGFDQKLAPIAPGDAPGVDRSFVKDWARERELKRGADAKVIAV